MTTTPTNLHPLCLYPTRTEQTYWFRNGYGMRVVKLLGIGAYQVSYLKDPANPVYLLDLTNHVWMFSVDSKDQLKELLHELATLNPEIIKPGNEWVWLNKFVCMSAY